MSRIDMMIKRASCNIIIQESIKKRKIGLNPWSVQSLDLIDHHSDFVAGSGLYTFVLYLGPHIAFFTMKAMQCGRIESILWGFGTALGELPPYFISRAASISSGKSDELEEFNNSTGDHNGSSSNIDNIKRWLLSHSQYLNFFTILLLAFDTKSSI
nr:vacuole membrane protein KMS1-like [Tanacetum cinerariifolium]